MKKKKTIPSGFTLVELMIVIVILGILTVVGLFAFQSAQQKSRDSRRKSELGQLAKALEMYNNDFGAYPSDSGGKINSGCTSLPCEWGVAFGTGTTVYMTKLPKDPSPTKSHYYYEKVGTYGYRLYARMENLEDGDIPTTGQKRYDKDCRGTGMTTAVYCNYAITSSNVAMPTPVL